MAVSLKDIAERLNVSTATVSLTLSGQGDVRKVSKETQQRVIACAKELNYQPNVLARSLNTGYSRLVGSYEVITQDEYNALSSDDKQLYDAVSDDDYVYEYNYFSDDGLKYNLSDDYEVTFEKGAGENNYILKNPVDALFIKSNTEVIHSLFHYEAVMDLYYSLRDYFALDKNRPMSEVSEEWADMDSNNVSDYLNSTTNTEVGFIGDLVMSDAVMNIGVDLSTFGIKRLFNTYAQSSTSAKTMGEGDVGMPTSASSAFSGAIAVQVFDTTSNAV